MNDEGKTINVYSPIDGNCYVEGKRTYIGTFKTMEEATKVRKDAELKYYTHAPK
jgi:hypothetical protein